MTITDSKPCVITQTFVIVEPAPLSLSATLQHALACDLSNDGAIDLLVSGGTPPYAYIWSNGSNQEDLTQLTNGNYSVTVTDSRNCVIQGQYTILRPDPIAIQIVENVDFDCETRHVDITYQAQVSGGVPPFAISWSSGTVSGPNNQFMNT
ncbi:MAG TPA: SprB repeat-containing protein, partial [Flavobacterium sp.]|nr:SprB repeat-containing protein [Flavobacterium sp.]